MLIGRTVTKSLSIESRQYELLSMDLGEGIRRRMLGLGTLAMVSWIAITLPILGATGLIGTRPDVASLIILAPPIILIMLGFLPDERVPRRMKVTTFALRVLYLLRGHRPLVALGQRPATRQETQSFSARLRNESEEPTNEERTQEPIRRHVKARLIGNEHVAHVLQKQKGKK